MSSFAPRLCARAMLLAAVIVPAATATAGDGTSRRQAVERPSPAAPSNQAESDCDKRWRLYLESQRCFGRYRTTTGGIKPEAFRYCVEYPDPSRQCGTVKPTTLPDTH